MAVDDRDDAAGKEVPPPPSYRSLAAPVANPVDKFALLPAFLKVRGLVKEHIDSFNYFITRGIRNIVQANNRIEARNDPNIYLRYTNVHVGKPSVQVDYKIEEITPHFCRLTDRTYSAPIRVDIEYTVGKQHELQLKRNVLIGYMPIMLRSYTCILHGKDEAELARLGECPLDPGGYFIVKGTEKVILIQEQLSKNRIIIDTDSKGRVIASVTSSTHEIKSKTVITLDKEKIYLQLNQFTKPIPIIVVMKAMGMESDQEVVQMVGRDPRYGDLLFPSIQECASERIYTQQQALQYMDEKVTYPGAGNQKEGRSKSILRDVFIAHVPDYVGNKRLELSGQLISLLFEDLFKTMNSQAVEMMNRNSDKTRSSPSDFSQLIKHEAITSGLERAISTGNWDIKRFRMHRKGVSQVLSRLSYMASLGYMTRITPQFEKTRKTSGPRALQPSQWGMLCPCDTPEGEACGLTKNLALLTHVTTDQEEGPLMNLCKSLGVEDLTLLSGEEIHAPGSFLVMFNGLILGKHRQPQTFAKTMRKLRRSGQIGEFVSIFVNEKQHCIHIASDGGRVCRPLIIADMGISRVKEDHMKELRDGIRSFDDFLRDGLIEYLDVNEENNALIALYEHVDQDDVERSSITHIEIEPLSILGVVSGLIPYPHHNQSPPSFLFEVKVTFLYNVLQLFRADSLLYLLVYAQRPLLTTKTIELVGYDKLGAGQNATVAVMGYSGYDIEDAIVMNKSSLDRGFGRCIAMKKYTVMKENYGDGVSDRIAKPQRDKDSVLVKQNMRALDEDGIAAPGQIIRNHDVYVNKQTPSVIDRRGAGALLRDREYKDSPAIYKGVDGETTVVDRVMLCSDTNDKLSIKCIIRHTRRPEVGDKFSSRHGQKGVCGTIVQQEDFPFSERGICPDLIMNPHGFPRFDISFVIFKYLFYLFINFPNLVSRKMIELIGGKAGLSCGRFHYGSAFGEPSGNADKVEDISNTLIKHGFSYNGKDFLYSGILGHPLEAYIFMGPIYYQKLKHMVLDKMHARASGPRVLLTRQPTEGRSRDGGLRLGEMERDCLIAYGASMLIFERLLLSSDPYQVQVIFEVVCEFPFGRGWNCATADAVVLGSVCRKCGLLGYYNHKLKASYRSMCKNGENMAKMRLPYACKLLFQELQAMNVVPRLKLTEG
ncbi:DNA-directed RNA polymerase III subunit 2 [Dichanthelium oligosanthes]|uniref:DNA-directed RNA polymerase subunit beta n=1 Tax=Dichanthelium oligosanthes TaxID=888268 RepID=A0A1E5WH56_9POAL|nr:DNA-directed RNA polymerase III subunit 2 [Dichanthelium oligosanthes]